MHRPRPEGRDRRARGGQHHRRHRLRRLRRRQRIERYGYGRLPNVLTALEFERLTNASGPTGGKIVIQDPEAQQAHQGRRSGCSTPSGPQPRNVAIIHCVGSRDHNYNAYCSRVCCMYSLKFAHLVHGEAPRGQLLRVLHRHARLREGLRGVRRPYQSRRHLRGARPHGQGQRRERPDDRARRRHRKRPHGRFPWIW